MAHPPRQSGYRPAVVTFLDILGFRELVSQGDPAEIRRVLNLLGHFVSAPPADDLLDEGEEETVSFNFSDCVIRIRHYDVEYPMGALHHEILALVHAQAELVHRNVLVRGGITTGDVYCEGGTIFGPAFNRAYELESEYATFPRIVIGPEAFAMLRRDPRLVSDHHDLVDEIHYSRNLLRQGDDGLWYVDYLRAIQGELDEPENYPNLLDEHRTLILSRSEGARRSPRVMHKLLWLARYHNAVCKDFDPSCETVIDRSSLPELEDLAERSPYHND